MNNDLNIFIKTIFLEAGSTCSIDECLGVGWVIRNRVKKGGWYGHGYEGVCLKSKQFSCWNDVKPGSIEITNQFRWRICIAIADYIINAPEKFNPLPGVCFYFNAKLCRPKWAGKMKKVEYNTYLDHVFYKEK